MPAAFPSNPAGADLDTVPAAAAALSTERTAAATTLAFSRSAPFPVSRYWRTTSGMFHRCATSSAHWRAKAYSRSVASMRHIILRLLATSLSASWMISPRTTTRQTVAPGAWRRASINRTLACRPLSHGTMGPRWISHRPSAGMGRPSRRVLPTKCHASISSLMSCLLGCGSSPICGSLRSVTPAP